VYKAIPVFVADIECQQATAYGLKVIAVHETVVVNHLSATVMVLQSNAYGVVE
jgi:hypothetical protein